MPWRDSLPGYAEGALRSSVLDALHLRGFSVELYAGTKQHA
jgi:hypothetical protein